MKNILLIALLLPLLFGTSCKKDKLADELSKLPPATQTGANTFGCLVNGKAWMPDNGCTLLCPQALKFYYSNSKGGEFSIRATYKNVSNGEETMIGIGLDSILSKRSYSLPINYFLFGINYQDYKQLNADCQLYLPSDISILRSGKAIISYFNLSSGIISGTFEFTLSKPGCETIDITNGRFDARL